MVNKDIHPKKELQITIREIKVSLLEGLHQDQEIKDTLQGIMLQPILSRDSLQGMALHLSQGQEGHSIHQGMFLESWDIQLIKADLDKGFLPETKVIHQEMPLLETQDILLGTIHLEGRPLLNLGAIMTKVTLGLLETSMKGSILLMINTSRDTHKILLKDLLLEVVMITLETVDLLDTTTQISSCP